MRAQTQIDWLYDHLGQMAGLLILPLAVIGAVAWILGVSLFLMFLAGVPIATYALLAYGEVAGLSSGWSILGVLAGWAIWWPVVKRLTG